MYDRFTRESRTGRGKIPKRMRREVYERDEHTCQFCGVVPPRDQLTIDHLVPLARGGLDELHNYVTACRSCNERKGCEPLASFVQNLDLEVVDLPVHGDPIIDNADLPIEIRLIRKRIFDRLRSGELRARGRQAQKKIEKAFRRTLWETEVGRQLEAEFPLLPGHVRASLPEIRTIAADGPAFLLLVELAKSANTRNLIGSVLVPGQPVVPRVRDLRAKTADAALAKRLDAAFRRWNKQLRARGWSEAQSG